MYETSEYMYEPDSRDQHSSGGSRCGAPVPSTGECHRWTYALSEEGSDRAHDLIDLMLIGSQSQLDLADIKSKCIRLFDYRRKQAWPPEIRKGDEWDAKYEAALGTVRDNSDICHTVDEAVVWVNKFVAQIEQA